MRRLRLFTLYSCETLSLFALTLPTFGQTAAQLKQEIQTSQRVSQLEMVGGAPFHLFATFTLYVDGVPAVHGTIDELWKDPRTYRRIITLPDRTFIEVDPGTTAWRTGDWSLPHGLPQLLDIFTPFSPDALTTNRLSLWHPPNLPHAPTRLRQMMLSNERIMTEPEIPGVDPHLEMAQTSYDIDKGSHELRAMYRGDVIISFGGDAQFANKLVAGSLSVTGLTVSANGVTRQLLARLRVDTLEPATDFSALDASAPPGANLSEGRPTGPVDNGEVVLGQPLIDTVVKSQGSVGGAVCPPDAELGDCSTGITPPNGVPVSEGGNVPFASPIGIRGRPPTQVPVEVVVKIHIDVEGKVASATVISATSDSVGRSAVSQAKKQKYRVSYQGDKLVSVDRIVVVPVGKS